MPMNFTEFLSLSAYRLLILPTSDHQPISWGREGVPIRELKHRFRVCQFTEEPLGGSHTPGAATLPTY